MSDDFCQNENKRHSNSFDICERDLANISKDSKCDSTNSQNNIHTLFSASSSTRKDQILEKLQTEPNLGKRFNCDFELRENEKKFSLHKMLNIKNSNNETKLINGVNQNLKNINNEGSTSTANVYRRSQEEFKQFELQLKVNQYRTLNYMKRNMPNFEKILSHDAEFIKKVMGSEKLIFKEKLNLVQYLLKLEYQKGCKNQKNHYSNIVLFALEKLDICFTPEKLDDLIIKVIAEDNLNDYTSEDAEKHILYLWENFVRHLEKTLLSRKILEAIYRTCTKNRSLILADLTEGLSENLKLDCIELMVRIGNKELVKFIKNNFLNNTTFERKDKIVCFAIQKFKQLNKFKEKDTFSTLEEVTPYTNPIFMC